MASEMSFRELFDHLGEFLHDKELRWRQCMRVKRGLPNPNMKGGYGNDQIYFEGKVHIGLTKLTSHKGDVKSITIPDSHIFGHCKQGTKSPFFIFNI